MASTVLNQKMYTREEAAGMLGLSLRTFDRLRYAGEIEEIRLSPHKVRFTEEMLQARIRHQKADSADPQGQEDTPDEH